MDALLALSSLHSSKKATGSAKERAEEAKQLADDLQDAWCSTLGSGLLRTNISHLGKRQIIFKSALVGDMLVPRNVILLGFLTGSEAMIFV